MDINQLPSEIRELYNSGQIEKKYKTYVSPDGKVKIVLTVKDGPLLSSHRYIEYDIGRELNALLLSLRVQKAEIIILSDIIQNSYTYEDTVFDIDSEIPVVEVTYREAGKVEYQTANFPCDFMTDDEILAMTRYEEYQDPEDIYLKDVGTENIPENSESAYRQIKKACENYTAVYGDIVLWDQLRISVNRNREYEGEIETKISLEYKKILRKYSHKFGSKAFREKVKRKYDNNGNNESMAIRDTIIDEIPEYRDFKHLRGRKRNHINPIDWPTFDGIDNIKNSIKQRMKIKD